MNNYILQLNNKCENNHEFFEQLRQYAEEHDVPIIQRDSLLVIQTLIKSNCVKKILEIGTAIGYSALSFCNVSDDVTVDTIERNPTMYQEAIKNIKELHKENQINVFHDDALLIDLNKLSSYDLIFIDAAKAQYLKFFNRFEPLLNEHGLIVTDNILFHGCVENQSDLSKNVLNMAKKLDQYNHVLNDLQNYTTYYLDSGDGLAVTMRKKNEVNS